MLRDASLRDAPQHEVRGEATRPGLKFSERSPARSPASIWQCRPSHRPRMRPANGTVTKLTLRSCLSCSIDSDGVVPAPGEPTLYLPGSFFIRSISSFMSLAGKSGWTSHEFGEPPALVTGIRSFSTSNGILL